MKNIPIKLVIDTNIIFSSLLKNGKKFRDIIFFQDFEVYSCNYSIVEIFKHREKLLKCSKLKDEELLKLMELTFKNIDFVSDLLISDKNLNKAYELCKIIDKKDYLFIALALELDCKILTVDKKLKNYLKNEFSDLFFDFY